MAQGSPKGGDEKIEGLLRRGHGQQRRGIGPQGDEGVGAQVQLAAHPVDEVIATAKVMKIATLFSSRTWYSLPQRFAAPSSRKSRTTAAQV